MIESGLPKSPQGEVFKIFCKLDSTERVLRILEQSKEQGTIDSYQLRRKSGFGPIDANVLEFVIVFAANASTEALKHFMGRLWDKSPEKKYYPLFETRRRRTEDSLSAHQPIALLERNDDVDQSTYIYETAHGRFKSIVTPKGIKLRKLKELK